jgi:hypothetical protein
MARRILPSELKRICKCLFVSPHEARQLLFKSDLSAPLSPVCSWHTHAEAGGRDARRAASNVP